MGDNRIIRIISRIIETSTLLVPGDKVKVFLPEMGIEAMFNIYECHGEIGDTKKQRNLFHVFPYRGNYATWQMSDSFTLIPLEVA